MRKEGVLAKVKVSAERERERERETGKDHEKYVDSRCSSLGLNRASVQCKSVALLRTAGTKHGLKCKDTAVRSTWN
jgi:hypothetical protein